jgi:uncharacterized membrane-anchored protein YhcB (DUF1043 family)
MNEAWAAIIVALIGLVGGIITVLLQKTRNENKNDHAYVVTRLEELHEDVKDVGKKVDNHISWHLDNKE